MTGPFTPRGLAWTALAATLGLARSALATLDRHRRPLRCSRCEQLAALDRELSRTTSLLRWGR